MPEWRMPCTDQITNLPEPIIGQILSLLPFKEAVRTSVISKPWRRLWTHTANIDLDKSIIPRDANPNRWADVADSILSLLQGSPITNCYLAWPENFNQPDPINRFLRILLRSGIQKLKLGSSFDLCNIYTHTIPLDLLSCQTLTKLDLRFCNIPRFPQTYPAFNTCRSLEDLRLENVDNAHDGDINCLISSCKFLRSLELICCKGVRHLSICNTNLSHLDVESSSAVTLSLEGATSLARVSICYGLNDSDTFDWEAQDPIQLLKLPVSVESLDLIITPAVTKLLPSLVPPISSSMNLKRLEIDVYLSHAYCVSLLAYLLRNSPYLKELDMWVWIDEKLMEPITEIDFWDKQCSFLCLTHHFVRVKLCFLCHYDDHANSFMKYLLANTPLLKNMHIDLRHKEDNVRMLPMKKASPNVEITVRELFGERMAMENVL